MGQTLAEGDLGSYHHDYRSDAPRAREVKTMTILAPRKINFVIIEGIRRGVATAEATVFVRDLCNHPSM